MPKLMIPEIGREVDETSVADLRQCIYASLNMLSIVSSQISEASMMIYNIYAADSGRFTTDGQRNNNIER